MTAAQLDVLDVLTAFLSWDEVARLVRAGDANEAVRRRALRHPEPRVRRDAALLMMGLVDVMEWAAADTNYEVRQVAAKSRATPPGVLGNMMHDRSRSVRQRVASNKSTPSNAVEHMAFDPVPEVRLGVACRPLSLLAMVHLSNDPCAALRRKFAGRPDLPDDLCANLAADHDARVRAAVARRPAPVAVFERLAKDSVRQVVASLASNTNIGRPVALLLAKHADCVVRSALAFHNQDAVVLDLLAADAELPVRAVVALNPYLPLDTALRMLDSPSGLLRRLVLARHHENIPEQIAQRVLDQALGSPKASVRDEVRQTFAQRIQARVITSPPALTDRRGLFEVVDQGLPFALIAHAVNDPAVPVTVRAGLLEHPYVPAKVLAQLKKHPHETIRFAATQPRKRILPL